MTRAQETISYTWGLGNWGCVTTGTACSVAPSSSEMARGWQAQQDKLPSPAPGEGLVTKHSSRGQTHYLIPASCRHAGPDIQLDVNPWGGHWGAPQHTHTSRSSHVTTGLGYPSQSRDKSVPSREEGT